MEDWVAAKCNKHHEPNQSHIMVKRGKTFLFHLLLSLPKLSWNLMYPFEQDTNNRQKKTFAD